MPSWFQLSALFEHQTKKVLAYKPSCKRYFLNLTQQKANFVKRTHTFSRWVQGVFANTCKVIHVRPNSSCIEFWKMCIPRVKDVNFETAEHLLSQHQPVFAQVRDLRHV